MTTRTHLSIGEVLSLLTDDFPDLTITKIRFLESQGLISPERTASGYRKFYDFDIERLRWILRQQRENFLPLKVIRDRLERSGPGSTSQGSPEDPPGQVELDLARDPGKSDPPPVWMADHAASQPPASSTNLTPAQVTSTVPGQPDPMTTSSTPRQAPVHSPTPTATSPSTTMAAQSTGASPPPKAPKPKPPAKTEQPVSQTNEPKPEQASKTQPGAAPAPVPSATSPMSDMTDVSMTRAQIVQAANLTERQLGELESFGIVVASDGDTDEPIYGADALVCARQAGVFLRLGMEPRHLRAFKVAADREAGLYEQLFLPLLRQRNPKARADAIRIVDQLTTAGAAIHAALLQQSLRGQLRSPRNGR